MSNTMYNPPRYRTSVDLTERAYSLRKQLAKELGISQGAVMEMAIRELYRYHESKFKEKEK